MKGHFLALSIRSATALCLVSQSSAQTAPQIGHLFPAGAQRGTTVEVALDGKYLPGPCGVWIGGEGLTSKSEKTEGRLTFEVAPDAAIGTRDLRIFSVQGGSPTRPFVIGSLPEIMEGGSDVLAIPVTINGRIYPKGDIDEYRLKLRAGQQIVCSVAAASLGSPNDTVLQLCDPSGEIVASENDHEGPDPLLVYQCKSEGDFVLRIYNYNLGGGDDHVYRLTVTDGPYLDFAFPSGLQAGTESKVTLYGWNLDPAPYSVTTTDPTHEIQPPGGANVLRLPVTEFPSIVEAEPNNSADAANEIHLPLVIHGRFEEPGDSDFYRVAATKGDQFHVEVLSTSLGLAADPVLTFINDKGAVVKEIDDAAPAKGAPVLRDPKDLFTAPADGVYYIKVTERASRSGPKFIYQLHVVPPRPGVELFVKTSEFAIIPGEKLTIPVVVARKDGYPDDIEISAEGLPSGITVEPQTITAKSPPAVKLELTAAADAPFSAGVIRLVAGEAKSDQLWLAVSPKVPFELTVPTTIQEAPRLAAFPFPVTIKRDEGFTGAVRLIGVEPDARGTVVAMEGTVVPGAANSGVVPLLIQAAAVEGTTHRCRVMGVAEITGPDGAVHPVFHLPAGAMMLGCQPNLLTLTAEPQVATWAAGQTIQLTVNIERRAEMGEVTVSLTPPPQVEGVSAESLTIPPGQTEAVFKIDVAPGAGLGPQVELELRASATRAGLPVGAVAPVVLVEK